VVADRDPIPGIANTWFNEIGISLFPSVDNAGRTVFTVPLAIVLPVTSSNNDGVWKWDSGVVSNVLREADPAPGTGAGVIFAAPFSGGVVPQIANGKIVAAVNLTGPNVTTSNNTGIWLHDGNTLSKVVQKGDPAPAGGVFGSIAVAGLTGPTLAISDSAEVFFNAKLSAGNEGIFSAKDGVIKPIVLTGPPLGQNDPYFFQTGALRTSSFGPGAFWAVMQPNPVTFPFPEAIWSWSDGQLQEIVRTHDAAPEIGPDIEFKQFTLNGPELAVNDFGQMVFSAVVGRPEENGVRSLWVYDPASGVHYIARIGDLFEVLPGDSRTIGSFSFASNGLNDAGELALKLGFTDGSSGIFLTNVPEPAILMAIASSALVLRRRWPRL